jgi:CRP-like cAMP-binding protein
VTHVDDATHALIQTLHGAGKRFCLVASGGGTRAIAMLLDVPGGGQSILEARVPYSARAFDEYLGCQPESYCSAETSREMARRAYERAQWLAPQESVIGVGCTASLVSDRPKRGDHRLHVSFVSAASLQTYSLVLTKQARARAEEETVVDAVILNALAEAAGILERVDVPLLTGETVQTEVGEVDRLSLLLSGRVPALRVDPDGKIEVVEQTAERPRNLIVAGAFNPVHEGHWRLAEVGTRLTGLPSAFELSTLNVDKPPLAAEIRSRLAHFAWRASVWLTRAPTFVEKARLFPGSVFAMASDTAVRIVSPRYYGGSEEMNAALAEIHKQGCRFLVAGRHDPTGRFIRLAELNIPAEWRELFSEVPEAECCLPMSSTELRRRENERKGPREQE